MPGLTIEREILIEAPVKVVWRTITEPDQMSQWFADKVELVAGFDDAKPGPFGPFGRQRELDQHRVTGHRFLTAGVVPAEREAGWRVDGLHDDRASLVSELHVAMSPRLDHEVYPVGEPLAYLIRLGDGAPHHLHRRLDQDLPLDYEAWHQYLLPSFICNQWLHNER